MKEEEIDQQSIPPMVKYILNFIKTDSSISSITLHPCHYKVTFLFFFPTFKCIFLK